MHKGEQVIQEVEEKTEALIAGMRARFSGAREKYQRAKEHFQRMERSLGFLDVIDLAASGEDGEGNL